MIAPTARAEVKRIIATAIASQSTVTAQITAASTIESTDLRIGIALTTS